MPSPERVALVDGLGALHAHVGPIGWLGPDLYSEKLMVLSDRTIKEEIAAGRLVFDPYDESLVQPSSVDVRVDRSFRVFHNSRYPYIDVRQPMEELTELVSGRGRGAVRPPSRASSCSARRSSG